MADSLVIEEALPFAEDMASSVIVEPAAADALPASAMQFADLTESGSESGDEQLQQEQQQSQQQQQQSQQQQQQLESSSSGGTAAYNTPAARSSPPPNCAICLSRCRRKCFTDSCMHQFCFKCLCEWSKIKPECPLCKQPFKTIIHNVRTFNDDDRYPVEANSALNFRIFNIRSQRYMLQNQAVMTVNDPDAVATDESQDEASLHHSQYYRSEPYRMQLLNFYRNDLEPAGSSLSQLWRRYVYDRKLYALPVSDRLTGRFREWSARFYRDNPSQMHRLMPWINRDIVCLLRATPQNVDEVMQILNNNLPMINIPTRTFRRHLSPFLGERTNHFIHELFNFARSPYDMVGYDRVVTYSARAAEEVEVDLLDLVSSNDGGASSATATGSSSSSNAGAGSAAGGAAGAASEVESIGDIRGLPRPVTSVIVTNPSATHSFSVTMATDGSELPGISIRRTTTSNVGSQTVAINLSMRRPANDVIEIGDDGDAAANAEVAAINDGSNQAVRRQALANLPISAHIELQSSDCSNSSDDDDECVFVLERKPPHLRTPELVSLHSNSDSDVVFVDEQRPSPPPKAAPISSRDSVSNEQAASAALANELFMGASTSTGMLSTSGKNWKMVLEDARRQDLMRLRSGRGRRNVTRAQQQRSSRQPAAASAAHSRSASGSGSGSTNWSTTSDSSSNSNSEDTVQGRRRKRSTRKPRTRKRVAKPHAQFKSKRRRKQEPSEPDEQEQQQEKQQQQARRRSSSDSSSCADESSADSSEAAAAGMCLASHSSNSSDDDSTENLMLSALRATLKAEVGQHEDRKPPKRELDNEDEDEEATGETEEQQQEQEEEEEYSLPKRRRSCNSNSGGGGSSSNSNSNLSSHNSNSVTSTLASRCTTTSSISALGLFTRSSDTQLRPPSMVLNPLIELSTLCVEAAGGGSSVAGLFNEQSQGVVEDSLGRCTYLRNTLPSASSLHAHDDDAQLGMYSDASNELQQHYGTAVKQALSAAEDSQEESIDVTNHQPDELEPAEQQQGELEVEEEEEEDEDENNEEQEQAEAAEEEPEQAPNETREEQTAEVQQQQERHEL
ncbi:hypothetical protein KR222_000120, partial [Zaprionus bogoriensis]